MLGSELWGLVTIGGPILLLIVIAFVLMRRRKLSSSERAAQVEGTERGYKEPEKMH